MKDRLIQLVAFVVLIAALAGAFLMTPGINKQRVEQKLTYNIDAGDDTNPVYTFVSLLGPVRGFMVNVLWQRSEELKREGKFFEANQLAEMITTLQPRYPEAWNFQGWNMAYNISVKTKTKEERWDWVKKGMDLIRDRGIPNNPNGVVLYRSLAWILDHKMGGQTDDMHWHYKMEFAEEWQVLLGTPVPGWDLKPENVNAKNIQLARQGRLDPHEYGEWRTTQRFARIADYANKYLRKPDRPEDDFNASNYFTVLSPTAREQFFEDHPGMEDYVAALAGITDEEGESMGFGLNSKTLRAMGRLIMFEAAGYRLTNPLINTPQTLGVDAHVLFNWGKERDAEQDRKYLPGMLTLLRAMSLIGDYHMDPAFMLECLKAYGPMDWRHPSAHACYWTRLGTLRAEGWIDNKGRIDLVNANRASIHALQKLAHYGIITFRPAVNGMTKASINHQPDIRMIPAYERACDVAIEKVKSGAYGENHDPKTYYDGHENFLHSAVNLYYFAGNKPKAEEYFAKAKTTYGDREFSPAVEAGHYKLKSVEDFVIVRMEDGLRFQKIAQIKYLIRLAYEKGLAPNTQGNMVRYLGAAQQLYNKLREEGQTAKRNDEELVAGRQDIPATFEELVLEYISQDIMASTHYTLAQKSIVWRLAKRQFTKLIDNESKEIYQVYREMMQQLDQQYNLVMSPEQMEQTEKQARQLAKLEVERQSLAPDKEDAVYDYFLQQIRRGRLYQGFEPPAGYREWEQRMLRQSAPKS